MILGLDEWLTLIMYTIDTTLLMGSEKVPPCLYTGKKLCALFKGNRDIVVLGGQA